jgi:hypothetical protein
MGPPLEVQAVLHIYNINNNKHEHEEKNNRGERFINITFPPSTWERLHPPTSPYTAVAVQKGCP